MTSYALTAFTVAMLLGRPSTGQVPSVSWEETVSKLEALLERGDTTAARAELERALRTLDALPDASLPSVASRLEALATPFAYAPDVEAWTIAEDLLTRSVSMRTSPAGKTDVEAIDALETLATLAYDRGDYERSVSYRRQAITVLEERFGASHPRVADARSGLAATYFYQGRYSEAATESQRALEIFDHHAEEAYTDAVVDLDTTEGHVHALNVQAEIHRVRDELEGAEAALLRARRLTEALDGESRAGAFVAVENTLAGLYADQGRYEEAEATFRPVLALWESAPGTYAWELPTGYLNHAQILRFQGRLVEALPFYERALAMARAGMDPDDPQLVFFINQMAVAYSEGEKFDRAFPLFNEAVERLEASFGAFHPMVAQSLHDQGDLLANNHLYDAAIELYRRALDARERAFGSDHPLVGVTLARSALAELEAGIVPADIVGRKAERATAILSSTSSYPEARADGLATVARAAARSGDLSRAIRTMNDAIAIVETLRTRTGGTAATRADFFGRYVGYYDSAVAWELNRGNVAAAVEISERARARVLLEQMRLAQIDLRAGVPPETLGPLQEEERDALTSMAERRHAIDATLQQSDLDMNTLRERLAELQAAYEADVRRYREAAARIERVSPQWNEILDSSSTPLSFDELLQATLRPRTGLVVYQLGAKESFVIAVGPGDAPPRFWPLLIDENAERCFGSASEPLKTEHLFALASDAGLLAAMRRSASELRGLALEPLDAPATPMSQCLHALFRTLVPNELWERMRSSEELVVIPDGPLFSIPFETLVIEPATADGERTRTRYWLDAGPVLRYAPSLTTLARLSQNSGTVSLETLVVADPDFRAPDNPERARSTGLFTDLPPLPGTLEEARAIDEAFAGLPSASVTSLIGAAATEANVRDALSRRPDIIHFATHGVVLEGRSELLAALALHRSRMDSETSDDGFLHLYEIYDLGLVDAELTVLSACDTQVGRAVEGEGVFALARAFHAVGSRRVVASLWQVNDLATAHIMGHFYEELADQSAHNSEVNYAVALRNARRAARETPGWEAPYFWAPFVLTGLR